MTDNAALRAISIMHERYPDNLSVHEIAAEVAFSRYYFTRMFRRTTGTSPGQYLTAIRMAAAKTLLATTALTVGEVVERVGYQSVGTFTTRFSTATGMSPARYRRQCGTLLDSTGCGLIWLPVLEWPARLSSLTLRGPLGGAFVVLTAPWDVASADQVVRLSGGATPSHAVAYRISDGRHVVGLAVIGLPECLCVFAATARHADGGRPPRLAIGVGTSVPVTAGRVTRVELTMADTAAVTPWRPGGRKLA
jgi:AraC family transcriptional regulator